VRWAEAAAIRLEFRLGKLWLVFDPMVWFGECKTDEERFKSSDYVREKQARRYNNKASEILDAWVSLFTRGEPKIDLRAFSEAPGVEARFSLLKRTAFKGRSL
jgi:hypothetical protein